MCTSTRLSQVFQTLCNSVPHAIFKTNGVSRSFEEKDHSPRSSEATKNRVMYLFKLGCSSAITATRGLYAALQEKHAFRPPKGFAPLIDRSITQLSPSYERIGADFIRNGAEKSCCFFLIGEGSINKPPDFYALAKQDRVINILFTQRPTISAVTPKEAMKILHNVFDILSFLKAHKQITADVCRTVAQPHLSNLIQENEKNFTIVSDNKGIAAKELYTRLKNKSKDGYYYVLEQSSQNNEGLRGHPVHFMPFFTLIKTRDIKNFSLQYPLISPSKLPAFLSQEPSSFHGLKSLNPIGFDRSDSKTPVPTVTRTADPRKSLPNPLLSNIKNIYENSTETHTFRTDNLVITVSRTNRNSAECVDEIIPVVTDATGFKDGPDLSSLPEPNLEEQRGTLERFLLTEGKLQKKSLILKSWAIIKSDDRIVKIYPYFLPKKHTVCEKVALLNKCIKIASQLSKRPQSTRYIQLWGPHDVLKKIISNSFRVRAPSHLELIHENPSSKKTTYLYPPTYLYPLLAFEEFLKSPDEYYYELDTTGTKITSIAAILFQNTKHGFLQEFTPIHPLEPLQKSGSLSEESSEMGPATLETKTHPGKESQAPFYLFDLPVSGKVTSEDTSIRSRGTEKKS
ncbi:MAG: hypothetical protein AAGI90_07025 [Chlamydiota bacterium]